MKKAWACGERCGGKHNNFSNFAFCFMCKLLSEAMPPVPIELCKCNEENCPIKESQQMKYLTDAEVVELFGEIRWEIDSEGKVKELGVQRDLYRIMFDGFTLPTYGDGVATSLTCHPNIKWQMDQAFKEIFDRGLIDDIVFWGGCYNLRLIRGSTNRLSRHSWGIAFDINPEQNPIGATPAAMNEEGSVLRLVPIFEKWGFYWGGNFPRPDGMHFEACKIITDGDVDKKKLPIQEFTDDCNNAMRSVLALKEKWREYFVEEERMNMRKESNNNPLAFREKADEEKLV